MEDFLDEIRVYARAVGKEPSTIVQQATRQGEKHGHGGATWKRWESGGECTVSTMERIRTFIRENPARVSA